MLEICFVSNINLTLVHTCALSPRLWHVWICPNANSGLLEPEQVANIPVWMSQAWATLKLREKETMKITWLVTFWILYTPGSSYWHASVDTIQVDFFSGYLGLFSFHLGSCHVMCGRFGVCCLCYLKCFHSSLESDWSIVFLITFLIWLRVYVPCWEWRVHEHKFFTVHLCRSFV